MVSELAAGLLGVAQGVRHALEPDHLAAVSTLASDRPGVRGGFLLGAWWGLGHTASLLVVGGVLTAVGARLPPGWAAAFEAGVGGMLIALGVRAVLQSLREGRSGAARAHTHGHQAHAHAGPPAHVHAGRWTLSTRPLLVGLMHGLAGSGAISALVLAELPSLGGRLAFIALFGLGSVVGMASLTALVGAPLARLQRAPLWAGRLLLAVGLCSVVLGGWWLSQSAATLLRG